MEKQRDDKGRFVKGSSGNPQKRFNAGVAQAMQARSAESRKENHRNRETLRETLLFYLREKEKSGLTRQQRIVLEVLDNQERTMSVKDLRDIADILGELKLGITIEQEPDARPEIEIE